MYPKEKQVEKNIKNFFEDEVGRDLTSRSTRTQVEFLALLDLLEIFFCFRVDLLK